jgi:hypothetical protein
MNIWFDSISWLLWIRLLRTWICKYLFESLLLIPEVELLAHMVILYLVLKNWDIVSLCGYTFCISKGSNLSTNYQHLLFSKFFYGNHPSEYEVVSHCDFDFDFSSDYWCCEAFHVFISQLCIFCGEMSHQVLCKFFIINFLLGYIHYGEEDLQWQLWSVLHCTLSAPMFSPPQHAPYPT